MTPALQPKLETITLEQYEALPENRRVEIFDGVIYDMASPSQIHQPLSMELSNPLYNYVKNKKGSCQVFVSPANPSDDYIRKLYYYKNAGVREYWIVDPRRKTVTVNYFEENNLNVQYSFDSTIKVNIYDNLYINFSDIAELL